MSRAFTDDDYLIEEAEFEIVANTRRGPIIGPWHPGKWLILRAARSRKVIRWIEREVLIQGRWYDRSAEDIGKEIAREIKPEGWVIEQ